MGITVTPNLGLIKPDEDESIKEDLPTFAGWADHNADNCDTIDALFRATNTTFASTWGGSTGNPVLGAGGFVEMKYLRLFPRMVIVFFKIYTGGAGFTPGSGNYTLTLPVAVDTSFTTFQDTVPLGTATLYDDTAVLTSDLLSVVYHQPTVTVQFRTPSAVNWTATTPTTIAQQDRVSGYMIYPTAAA